MNTERTEIEKRIIEILRFINFPEIEKFINSLTLYKNKELTEIVSYLETGKMDELYQFLLRAKKEILEVHEEKRQLQNKTKLQKLKKEEEQEYKQELIHINF